MRWGLTRVVIGVSGLIALGLRATSPAHAESIRLDGQWRFALDRQDVGVKEQWFARELPDTIQLPGVLQAQGYGDEIGIHTPWVLSLYDPFWYLRKEYAPYTNAGAVKVPFISQPPRHYLGVAWYQRQIRIPVEWAGKHVRLFLERPRWETRVWVDNQLIGSNNSLCAPHEYELGELTPGLHTLTIRIDNRMLLPYRPDAHGVSDSLASSWNGIVGRIELQAVPVLWIDHVEIEPSVAQSNVYATVHIVNCRALPARNALLRLEVQSRDGKKLLGAAEQSVPVLNPGPSAVLTRVQVHGPIQPWDEFNPRLYRLRVTVASDAGTHSLERTFGFREVAVAGRDILINGRPVFLRGTHHGGDFPLTGYPPTDVEYWRKIFGICKQWGLNHVRFHSFCPPEAAFVAADELGLYLQIEPGMWNAFAPESPMERHLYIETERILRAYGHHPSFVMFSASNEPQGRWRQVLPLWAAYFKQLDPGRLYTPGTGFTEPDAPGPTEHSDYIAVQRFGRNRVRGPGGWFGIDYWRSVSNIYQPVVVHELGQWCAYPSFDIIKKFKGYMRPSNYEIFRDSAAAAGLLPLAKKFEWASGKFQAQCYKEDIEAVTRTFGLAGYQLLDLHDYLGQGTALVGVLDAFWDPRGYITPAEWHQFCNEIVALAWIQNRVLVDTNSLQVRLGVAHYGRTPVTNLLVRWSLAAPGQPPVATGEFYAWGIRLGKETNLALVTIPLHGVKTPAKYNFTMALFELVDCGPGPAARNIRRGKLVATNHWSVWVYSATTPTNVPPQVLLTRDWAEAEAHLLAGGRVIYVPPQSMLSWWSPPLDPVPVFWNRQMNPQWNRMLGLWCNVRHPALAGFPTEEFHEWQWSELVNRARTVNIGMLKTRVEPIVAAIDDWNRNWRLAPIFEVRVMRGRLLVCSFDIVNNLDRRPAARQLRRSLVDYAAGPAFNPRTSISLDELRTLWFDNLTMRRLGVWIDPVDAATVIDGNPNTAWQPDLPRTSVQHWQEDSIIELRFTNAIPIRGLIIMNRQNDRLRTGDIKEFVVESSNDRQFWREVVRGELASTFEPQTIMFPRAEHAMFLRFRPLSTHVPGALPAIAELAVITPYQITQPPPEPIQFDYRPAGYASPDIDEAPPPWQ